MAAWWPRVSFLLLLACRGVLAQPGVTTPLLQQQDSCGGGNLTWPCTCEYWNSTTDDSELEVGCCCTGNHLYEVPDRLDRSELDFLVQRLTIDKAGLVTLSAGSFRPYAKTLRDIVLTDLPYLRQIDAGTFADLPHLRTIDIKRAKSLQVLPPGIFSVTSGKLNTVRIMHTGLLHVPDLIPISNGIIMELIDLEGNNIRQVHSNSLRLKVNELILDYNDIEFVEGWAFNGSDCAKLSLKGNKALSKLSLNAFAGLRSLRDLDLSETAITQLPTTGLEELEYLRIEDTQSLKEIPSVYSFKQLKEAWLTYSFHCCAFHFPEQHNPERHAAHQAFLAKVQEHCDQSKATLTVIEADNSNGWHSLRRRDLHGSWASEPVVLVPPLSTTSPPPKFQFSDPSLQHGHGVFHPRVEKSNHKSSTLLNGHNANPNEVAGDESFHSTVRAPPKMQPIMCGTLYRSPAHVIRCHPAPDAFNPCEDIMGTTWLRVAVWVVVVTSVFGNLAVIIVLASSHRISRMTVPKFLMCNLAFADLCMGTYLLLIAAMDIHSIGVYFNFAHDWQNGPGCKIAGFITVFASQLSVYTLSIITLERWLAITYAMYLNKRLNLKMASHVMMAGWIYALTMAALPLFGISGYSKTSICLPMETSDIVDVSYLIFLLVMNGVAFLLILVCYIQIYLSLNHDTRRGVVTALVGAPVGASARGEMNVAKKMALLVFTDLACWAPIAFFGLTAVAGYPLIDVTRSKILLVSFYPLNSCANPFLYAILTSQYRRDVVLLLSRHGIHTKKAQIMRREAMVSNGPARTMSANHSQAHVPVSNNGKEGGSGMREQQFCQEINMPAQLKESGSILKACLILHGSNCTLCVIKNEQETFL